MFSNCDGGSQKITLVKDENIISNDKEVAETFNKFFKNSLKSLDIPHNTHLLNKTGKLTDPVDIAVKKFENHPSILDINNMIDVDGEFCFTKVKTSDIEFEVKKLNTKKSINIYEYISKRTKTSHGHHCRTINTNLEYRGHRQ